ncbi:2-deoxy-5-keto-D-gluconate 6-phosphate aldolase domain-containing protein [Subtercola sp. YIM 133946]|uniref:2-deoxy-5-keto-D-gluconate 6-phosphate aldolase domain-containing protein n=1 Tax=Subtercola sp. YIM 133946 TaxID=3118909 RepID=UPI002F956475
MTDPEDAAPRELLLLAMDHRESLQKSVYGITGEPTPAEVEQIAAGKTLIFEGLLEAVAQGIDPGAVGVLVDERYGTAVAEKALANGIDLAMPIEKSGQDFFTLEYGDFTTTEWLTHVETFDPAQVKVLVRDNPAFAAADRQAQMTHLAAVGQVLREAGRTFLIELLIPATPEQLKGAGDALQYDRELRPALTTQVIGELQRAGVEPDIWKIEGLETGDAAAAVVAAARQDGRASVTCIVLGRDAPADRLDHWLSVAAPVDGFRGFAIGRSIWEQPLVAQLQGTIGQRELVDRVAAAFTHFVAVYDSARAA